jgi:ABC-type transport system involved in multi-copper enzyme maturation permease subunit
MPIFDQGYQHWKGPLAGHGWRWVAVARHGVRAQLKGRIVRLLLLLAWLPAIALVVALAFWGLLEQQVESVLAFLGPMLPPEVTANPQEYRTAFWTVAFSFFFKAELACSLFLVLIVGPNLISRDLRFNALPLYFSRPLTRLDYFLGKLGVIGSVLAATVVVPAVGAYLLGLAFSLDLGVVRDTHRLLWAGVLYGLVVTVSAGTLMLALSSLSRRSIYVGLAWAGFVFLSLMVSSALLGIRAETTHQEIVRRGIARWVQDHPPPQGVTMYGPYPAVRYIAPSRPGAPAQAPPRDEARDRWMREWSEEFRALNDEAAAVRAEESRSDWRPVLSYATNLDRLGDWLLDTDSAWVTFGRAVERPRAAFGPMLNRGAGGRLGPGATQPANDRLLADRIVWQFPWYWSAGALAGLTLLSVLVLTRRVKSLDRLK